MSSAASRYQKKRMDHWNLASRKNESSFKAGKFYHILLEHYYGFLIPTGSRVLELGCGNGDLLASIKPNFGVGIDFSEMMIKNASARHPELFFILADVHEFELDTTFDYIIISDLINDLWDVQGLFEKIISLTNSRTRIIINYYNNLWRIPLKLVKFLGMGANLLEQNWFAPSDVNNLLNLSGYEVITSHSRILFPMHIPVLETMINRFIVHFIPFKWLALTNFVVARSNIHKNRDEKTKKVKVSVVVPARNEVGNIEDIVNRIPDLGHSSEIIFIEGHSKDNTFEKIKDVISRYPDKCMKLYRQPGKGKGDAVRLGFEKSNGMILMILDADMTVAPEDLTRFLNALVSGEGEFINGVRLVYPMEDEAMRFINMIGNKFFSLAFTWLLGQTIKDTLCGTKVLWKRDYQQITENRSFFGDFDPFGDFDLLFGAAKLNKKIIELPIRYRSRVYGDTNIDRWRHGLLLLRMVFFAARRIKFI